MKKSSDISNLIEIILWAVAITYGVVCCFNHNIMIAWQSGFILGALFAVHIHHWIAEKNKKKKFEINYPDIKQKTYHETDPNSN